MVLLLLVIAVLTVLRRGEGTLGSPRRVAAPADAPNVLLISIDTLRADALPFYGASRDTAPTMTALANEGVVFENSWAQAPSTSPTHASMFTSAYPSEHGIFGPKERLSLEWLTLAEHFYAHGFRTWAAASSVRFSPGVQLDQGFSEYFVAMKGRPKNNSGKAEQAALKAIATPSDEPWFGFVHFFDVHAPYVSPEPHMSRFLDGPSSVKPNTTVQFLHKHRNDPDNVSEQQLHDLRALYDGGVSFVDTRIANIMAAVKALDRPTIVLITADHGEAFFENGYLGHGTYLWESIQRVPFLIWAPSLLPTGERRSTVVQSVDIFPTLVSLAGLPVPGGLRGADVSPVVRGEEEWTGRRLVLQAPEASAVVMDLDGHLVKFIQLAKNLNRNENAKSRRRKRNKGWFFDLTLDPTEHTRADSSLRPARTEAVEILRSLADAQPQRVEAWRRTGEEVELLKEIGYME